MLNENPTKEEFEAAVYCDECFNDLDALRRQKETLKVQVVSKGVTNAALVENFFKMEGIAEYWQAQATKKARWKDLPWIKRVLYQLGVALLAGLAFLAG